MIKQGVVVKKSGIKTVRVEVTDHLMHPKYKKRYPITRSYLVHDESDKIEEGEKVTITPSIKRSKKKSWDATVLAA